MGSLIILLDYGYLHIIEFSDFDDLHGSHFVRIRKQMVYTHMAIIIGNVCNDLLIRIQLSYDMGPWSWQGVTYDLWNPSITNRVKPRESRLKELRISLVLSLGVKS